MSRNDLKISQIFLRTLNKSQKHENYEEIRIKTKKNRSDYGRTDGPTDRHSDI